MNRCRLTAKEFKFRVVLPGVRGGLIGDGCLSLWWRTNFCLTPWPKSPSALSAGFLGAARLWWSSPCTR